MISPGESDKQLESNLKMSSPLVGKLHLTVPKPYIYYGFYIRAVITRWGKIEPNVSGALFLSHLRIYLHSGGRMDLWPTEWI